MTMAVETKTVLLVGSAGRLGSLVAQALRSRPGVRLRVLNRRAVAAAPGVEVHQGSVKDPDVVDAAVKGADAVISTVNGGPDVVVDGQLALLEAAARHGVRRFVPSDYSGNYFSLEEGDNVLLELRRRVAERVRASGVGHSFVLSGGFMEVALSPFLGTFDFAGRRATPWGTGDEPLDLTSTADVAELVARVVFDERAHNQIVQYAGETTSVRKIAADFEAVTGERLEVAPRGDVQALRRWVAEKKAAAKSPMDYVFGQYQLVQLEGKSRLRGPLWNDRYPELRPTTVRELLPTVLAPR
jgi:uncharacterized protein YbjT (DUF2867 family)